MNEPSGYRLPSPMETYFKQRKLAAVMTSHCFVCGMRFDGTAEDAISAAKAHRLEAHPELVDRGQTARRRAAGIVGSADAAS